MPDVTPSPGTPRTPPDRSAPLSPAERWLIGAIVLVLCVRVATLGAYPLFDNTEARYAEIARKMLETGDWVTPQIRYGVPFWGKPPLSTWLGAAAFALFGVGEFAARLASLVPALGVAGLVAVMAWRHAGRTCALRAVLVLVSTPLFVIASGAVMTDPALFLGTTLSMVAFWEAVSGARARSAAWGYLFFAGIAVGLLAKGPVALVLTFLPVGAWTLWKGGIARVWQALPWVGGTLLAATIVLPWYVVAESSTPGFLDYFLVGEHWRRYTQAGWEGDLYGSAHQRTPGTIWLYLLVATLPWSLAGLALWWRRRRTARATNPGGGDPADGTASGWNAYLWLWLLASPAFFTPARNILFTYVLPGMPAFALLVAGTWTAAEAAGQAGRLTWTNALVMPVLLVGSVLFVLPGMAQTHSQQALIATYLAQRASPREPLVYVGAPPLSAEFYTEGRVITVADEADLRTQLSRVPVAFVALTDEAQATLNVEPAQIAAIGRFGRYTLVRAIPPSTSPATRPSPP